MWSALREKLSETVDSEEFKLWIDPLRPVEHDGQGLVLGCPNAFHRSWVRDHYLPRLRQQARELDPELKLQLAVLPGAAANAPASAAPRQMALPNLNLDRPQLNKRFHFDSFVAGGGNEYACAAARAVAQGRSIFADSLYLVSGTGLGKSHLTQAIGHHVLGVDQRCRVNYLTAEDFANQMISALRAKRMEQFKDRFRRGCDVLLLEEVPFLAGKDKTQEELVYTLDVLINAGKRVIFTGNQPPNQIKGLGGRLRSRLDSSVTVAIEPPDHDTRVMILRREAQRLGMAVPEGPLDYLAGAITKDIRRLISAFNGMLARSSLTGRAMDLGLAAEMVGQVCAELRRVTPGQIRDEVARVYGLEASALVSKSRKKAVTNPRNIAMFLCRRHTEASLKAIGGVFNRDHSTVMYGVDKIDRMLNTEPKLAQEISFIEQRLGLS